MCAELIRVIRKPSFWVFFFVVLLAGNLLLVTGTDWYQASRFLEVLMVGGEEKEIATRSLVQMMTVDMTNNWRIVVFPLILIIVTFGNELLREEIFENTTENHIAPGRLYLASFLANYVLSFLLFLVFFGTRFYRYYDQWPEVANYMQAGVVVRVIIYTLQALFFFTAAEMFVSVLVRKMHWIPAAVLTAAGAIVLILPGYLISLIPVLGNYRDPVQAALLQGPWTLLLYDADMSALLTLPFTPKIVNPSMTHLSAVLLQIAFDITGAVMLLLGIRSVTKQFGKGHDAVDADLKEFPELSQVKTGKKTVLVNRSKDETQLLYRILDGEYRSNSERSFDLPFAPEEAGFLIDMPMYHEKADIRSDLRWIRALQGKQAGTGRREIEEIVRYVGLDALANRTKSLGSYSEGEIVCYGIAAALLTDPKVLVLDGPLDDLGEHDVRTVEALLQKLEGDGKILLYDVQEAKEKGEEA